MKFGKLGLAVLLISGGAMVAVAQEAPAQDQNAGGSQQESLADAARKAQADKKEPAATPKVWDNDSISSVPGNVSVVGQENSGAPANQQAAGQNANAQTPEQKAAMQSELADAKAKLDSLKGDLDIEQRKYALDEQTYISNPNHEMDKSGAANLQNEKDDIAAKQQEIADLQKKIEDLQAQAAAADNGGTK
jgi:hypothetical protein